MACFSKPFVKYAFFRVKTHRQEEQISEVEENPRDLLLHALQALPSAFRPRQGGGGGGGGKESVALFRTTALHLYAWRATETPDTDRPSPMPSPAAVAAAAVESAASIRAVDERNTQMLLAKAVELEPFHVPSLAALAFVLLQQGSGSGGGGGRAMAKAEELLERAVEYAGRRGVCCYNFLFGGLCQEPKLVGVFCFGDNQFRSLVVHVYGAAVPFQDKYRKKIGHQQFEQRRVFSSSGIVVVGTVIKSFRILSPDRSAKLNANLQPSLDTVPTPSSKSAAPTDVLKALAHIHASQGRRSSAISLLRRAATTGSRSRSCEQGASEGSRNGSNNNDPLSLCELAQLLLAPYHRRRPRPLLPASSLPPVERKGDGGRNSGDGTAAADRPETDSLHTPLPPTAPKRARPAAKKTATAPPTGGTASTAEEALLPLTFPSDEDKNEATRLLARAFSSAGGEIPPESVYFGVPSDGDDGALQVVGDSGDGDVGTAGKGRGRQDRVLAEVHLAVSGFCLKRGRGGGSGGGAVGTGGRSGAGERQLDHGSSRSAKEWHLREAARISSPDTKAGITAR